MANRAGRTAVLIVRVWHEEAGEEALRARITRTLDVAVPESAETFGAASEAEVVEAVRVFLEELRPEP